MWQNGGLMVLVARNIRRSQLPRRANSGRNENVNPSHARIDHIAMMTTSRHSRFRAFIASISSLALLIAHGVPVRAQGQSADFFSQQKLEKLVAPIALYPDSLLTQILMAATYPLDVVQAARWRAGLGASAPDGTESGIAWIRWVDVTQSGWQLQASPLSVESSLFSA